ncbi:Na+/H+ antiporter subunit A, partial [Dietzia sp.]|uniref:Na+/H+ antiporter subunit A n=1 Tax=Dietzia sp. TaxID=1871616 RepID=UPI002FDA1091
TSRRAATQALLVTTLGGLAMLVGIIIFGESVGSYRMSDVVAAEPSGAAIRVALLLVIAGAITKSAIAPFHFWLPGAMAAPTPVSAYLHSAAMVKAGIFLIARLSPGLSGSPTWQLVLIGLGSFTMLMAGWRSLREYDLKLILAFGTVSQLGFLLILVGVGSRDTMMAGLAMLVAHSLFKSALFMSVGIIDHETGTRDIRYLSGLGERWPAFSVVFVAAAASMAGLPPLLGFVGKEAAITTILEDDRLHGMPGPVIAGVIVVGSVLTFAYSARLVLGALRRKPSYSGGPSPAVSASHRPGIGFLAVPALLALGGLAFGVYSAPLETIIGRYVDTAFPPGSHWASDHPYHLGLWHGFSLPLLLTAVVYVLGAGLYVVQRTVEKLQFTQPALGNADRIYDAVLAVADKASLRLTKFIQRGSLPLNIAIIISVFIAFPMTALLIGTREGLQVELAAAPAIYGLIIPVAIAVLGACVLHNRLSAVICVSVSGYALGAVFAFHGAPDLAITQVLVETLMMVVFVLVLRTLPSNMPKLSGLIRLRAWLALGTGVAVMVLGAYASNARSADPIGTRFPELAYLLGNGKNAVNVTLVDIRAWDTLGEITVLLVAATGVASLVFRTGRYGSGPRLADAANTRSGRRELGAARRHGTDHLGSFLRGAAVRNPDERSLVLEATTRIVFPTMMVLSLFFFFAGHNNPGGGFAGGLVAGLALLLRYLAGGRYELGETIPVEAGRILGAGLMISACTAVASMIAGAPPLSSATFEFHLPVFGDVKLVTALMFDVGIYLVVVGLVLDILRSLGARLELDARDVAELRERLKRSRLTGPGAVPLTRFSFLDDETKKKATAKTSDEGSSSGSASASSSTSAEKSTAEATPTNERGDH